MQEEDLRERSQEAKEGRSLQREGAIARVNASKRPGKRPVLSPGRSLGVPADLVRAVCAEG